MKNNRDMERCLKAAYDRIAKGAPLCRQIEGNEKGRRGMDAVLERGEQEYRGYILLPGTENRPCFVGDPPLWKENPVGDEEYVWGLNRHSQWKDYILCYCATGERKYLERIRLELTDWMSECPCPELTEDPSEAKEIFSNTERATPWRSLETGIRMFDAWNYAVPTLIQEGVMSWEEFIAVAECIRLHGEVLFRIAPLLWPEADHNHYVMENLGLLHAAAMLKEIPDAPEWASHACRELARCVQKQLTADGGQVEGSPSYHFNCMEYFCRWLLVAEELQIPVPGECRELIRKGMTYALCATRPTGAAVPWGDSDPREEAVIPAILAFKAFGESGGLAVLAGLLGEEKIRSVSELHPLEVGSIDWSKVSLYEQTFSLSTVCWQKELDQVMMRTDWGREALSVFFGCHIPCYNGHSHMDPASFDFCAYGKALVIDPGRFTYREGADRRLFKSAAMHNTLILGEREPYDYVSRWLFRNEKNGCICNVTEEDGFLAAWAIHTSYFPTIHSRLLILMREGFLVVWDRLEHYRGQKVDIWFHLDSLHVKQEGDMVYTDEEVSLAIRTAGHLKCELCEGRLSERIDSDRPSVRVRFTDEGQASVGRDYLTILAPFRKARPEISDIAVDREQSTAVFRYNGKGYRISWKDDMCRVEDENRPQDTENIPEGK